MATRGPNDLSVAILGAGFSGLAMGRELRLRGFEDFTIYEKAGDVGGTWRENTYPGVACDVPSHLYSFKGRPNPNWSERFSGGGEIQDYVKDCAAAFGLTSHLQFGKKAVRANHDGTCWHLTFEDGTQTTATVLISGIGGLHVPQLPDITGREAFTGSAFHTAQWDHSVSLTGKRVAIIGSAASAIQVAPKIAPKVASLDIYQRTPNYILPRGNYAYSDFVKSLLARVPVLQSLYRGFIFNLLDLRFPVFHAGENFMKRLARREFEQFLTREIPDPQLRAKLTPDYPLGCKRILVSDDYYKTLAADHVTLVTDPIAQMTETGVVSGKAHERPADVIIYATGFRTFDLTDAIQVTNQHGHLLADRWPHGPAAHKTLSVETFPDLYFLLGPNSALGHSSVVLMIEAQARYVGELLSKMRKTGIRQVSPNRFVAKQYDDRLQHQLEDRVWAGGCKSWYVNEHGRNFTLYPGSVRAYFRDLRTVDLRDYDFQSP
ncbi:MAG: NAD(P)/FAD-dependent oxidoreductase [Pseudomonadota bacterium]